MPDYHLGSRIRVAAINTHPIQHFAPLWREIAKANEVELKVFYCSDWGVQEYSDPGFGTTLKWDVDLLSGYSFEFLPIHRRPKQLGFWETDNPTVAASLNRFSPAVLLLFGYSHLTNWRALAWARWRGTRVLFFADSELKHARSPWRRIAKTLVVRAFFSQIDAALPIGDCNAAYFRYYGVPDDLLYWCGYPVDGVRLQAAVPDIQATRAAVRRRHGIGLDEFVFASVGKYIARKRPADIINAWLGLENSLKARSRLLLVGEGPLRRELEQAARKSDGRVILTGFLNQQEIPSYYAGADALVVSSEIDAHPLVVTEAACFGLPTIASSAIGCIGPNDTLRDDQNGLVYSCGNLGELRLAMQRLVTDRDLYDRLSTKARELSAEQDARSAANKFHRAFRNVMKLPRLGLLQSASRAISLARR